MSGTGPVSAGTALFILRPGTSQFLLIRRSAGRDGAGRWSLPGGKIERDETWQEAAAREALEETGVPASDVRLLAVTTAAGWLTVWGAAQCAGQRRPEVLLNDESDGWAWVTCGDLWQYPLWSAHWTALLDDMQGTTELEHVLRGIWDERDY